MQRFTLTRDAWRARARTDIQLLALDAALPQLGLARPLDTTC